MDEVVATYMYPMLCAALTSSLACGISAMHRDLLLFTLLAYVQFNIDAF